MKNYYILLPFNYTNCILLYYTHTHYDLHTIKGFGWFQSSYGEHKERGGGEWFCFPASNWRDVILLSIFPLSPKKQAPRCRFLFADYCKLTVWLLQVQNKKSTKNPVKTKKIKYYRVYSWSRISESHINYYKIDI